MEGETENAAEPEAKVEEAPAPLENAGEAGPPPENKENEPAPEPTEGSENVQPADSEHPPESEQPKEEGQEGAAEAKPAGEGAPPEGSQEAKVAGDVPEIPSAMGSGGKGKQKSEFITDSLMKFYKYMGLAPEEAEETRTAIEEIIKIDRAPYYERHAVLSKEIEDVKVKNNMIQKKVAQYFKKKKMDHVLKESGEVSDSQQKYNKKLDAYGDVIDIDTRERTAITTELTDLRQKREAKYQELTTLFEDMQRREKETGYGLINTKTGKIIPDKFVDRLLRLQSSQMDTVNTMRLKYIRLKYLVAETQNKITILDKIGENLYLRDYEQLKIENRGLEDKIEERDDELSKLRSKYQSNIQMLAHVREKSAALQSDIDNLKEVISAIDTAGIKVREQLNGFKQQRDYYRNMTNKIHDESGLLTETELLSDMEDSMEELKLLTQELENLKEENKAKAQHIRNIRKNIEVSAEVSANKKNTLKSQMNEKPISQPQFYKGRPTLYKPILPEDAFKNFKEYKLKPTSKKSSKKRD